jgi:peptidoglycan/LPS O-acetylase OafA/YrhL
MVAIIGLPRERALPSKDPIKHRNNFTFLRLILTVLVLLSHSSELIDGNRNREILFQIFHTISFGDLAVNGFFLLSGYLIVQSWQRSPELFSFLKKRILRIYPGFIAASLVCAFVVGPLGAHFPDYFTNLNVIDFLKEMFLLKPPALPPVFVGQPYPHVNYAMWTIAYEFRCYLFVALFGLIGIVNQRRLWLIFSIFVLILSVFPSISDKIYFRGSYILLGDPSDFIRFLSYFSAGGCFYLFRNQIRYTRHWVIVISPFVVLSLFESHILQIILPTLGAYIFFWLSFLHLPPLQNFGKLSDISYGVYLYGWPTQKLFFWYFPTISPWLVFVLTCSISFACGLLSWHLVERPLLKLK